MTAFWHHLRALWPGWTILAPLPFLAHAAWAWCAHEFHWENAVVLAVALALFATGPRSKKLFLGTYPVGLVGILYSLMKLVQNVGVSPRTVHLCDLRSVEVALFGVTVGGVRGTVHDWLQAHSTRALDVACAFPYAAFMFVCVGFAIWLYFRDYARMVRFGWCFLALNVAGFITYHLFPAAPPWYYHLHGCVVDMSAKASEGPNLARVDALLGVPYFHGMYGRASDVYGAMPSLHCAYALIVALEGWPVFGWPLRLASILFYLGMCFSAVYLDHHWVLDAIAGSAYSVGVAAALRRIMPSRSAAAAAAQPALEGGGAPRGIPGVRAAGSPGSSRPGSAAGGCPPRPGRPGRSGRFRCTWRWPWAVASASRRRRSRRRSSASGRRARSRAISGRRIRKWS